MASTDTQRRPSADRDHPLRVVLDAVLANKTEPKRAEIAAIPLVDTITDRQARQFVDGVLDYCEQIVELAEAGNNGEARRTVIECVEEYGDMVDVDAAAEQDGEDPRALAERIPRTSAPTRRSRVDVERDDALSRIPR